MTTSDQRLRRLSRGGWSVRIRYGADLRGRFRMPDISEPDAVDRAQRLERMARTLSEAGKHAEAQLLLTRAAAQIDPKRFALVEAKAAEVAASANGEPRTRKVTTFRDVCELWWSGELHRMAPDRVAKSADVSIANARSQLSVICQTVGDVPITRFTLQTAERALAALPRGLMRTTRRAYAHRIVHMLNLAASPPLGVISASPLPARWAPKKGPRRVFAWLYPDEDKRLLLSRSVNIEHRWLWGFMYREGVRIAEALKLRWRDLDLERGVINLDRNKTRVPRSWMLCTHVARALRDKQRRDGAEVGDKVFHVEFGVRKASAAFRADLRAARIDRPEFWEDTDERAPIGTHSQRRSFVTLHLANDKTEAWLMARTGHTTSAQLNQYRQAARFAHELRLGLPLPMDELLLGGGARGGGSGHGRATQHKNRELNGSSGRKQCSGDTQIKTSKHALSAAVLHRSEHPDPTSGVSGPAEKSVSGHAETPIEADLAAALRAATAAGEWKAVEAIAKELGGRRRERKGGDR